MTPVDEQIELAQELADELATYDSEIGAAEILDCLSTAGLTLARMGDRNIASAAYVVFLELFGKEKEQ